GKHMVEVIDPRGQAASKMAAFWARGSDHERPVVTFEKPGPLAAGVGGTTPDVAIRAFDPAPGSLDSLHWESSVNGNVLLNKVCRFEDPHASARCDFQVTVPASLVPGDEFVLKGIATDTAAQPNQSAAAMVFTVQR